MVSSIDPAHEVGAPPPQDTTRPPRPKSARMFVILLAIIVILAGAAYLVRGLLPKAPDHLQIQIRNHVEVEVVVTITVDGSSIDPFPMQPDERITLTLDAFTTDTRHTVVVSTPLHDTRTVDTRIGMGIHFQLFRDGTIVYSFF